MVADLYKRYENTCNWVKKNNIEKLQLDVLNLAFSLEVQIIVSAGELELLPELTKQYTQIETQILHDKGVNIA